MLTPYDVALRMLRAGCDTGLIAAYLRVEIEHDPTVAMTSPWQIMGYRLEKALQHFKAAFLSPPRQSDYRKQA